MNAVVIVPLAAFASYGIPGAVRIAKWARRTRFSLGGDGPEALIVLLVMWLVWPALRNTEDERP